MRQRDRSYFNNIGDLTSQLQSIAPQAAVTPNSLDVLFGVCLIVLVLEGMAQTAGTLCIRSLPGQTTPALVYFLTIDKAKFRKPVVPGDVLEYHVNRIKRRKNMWWFRGEAKVAGEIVAEAELGAMIAEA